MRYDDYSYLLLNGAGATLILVSLLYTFNLAAFVMEGIWVAISIYGAAKRWRREHRWHPTNAESIRQKRLERAVGGEQRRQIMDNGTARCRCSHPSRPRREWRRWERGDACP